MSFSDWLIFNNGFNGTGGQPAAGLSTTYFSGSSALVFSGAGGHSVDAGGVTASANAVPDTLPKGFLHGKIRTLSTPALHGPSEHGLICMQSVDNMQGGVGAKGYCAFFDSIFFSNKLSLCRMNDGISANPGGALGTTYSVLGASPSGMWTVGTGIYALEIEWHVDALLGGIYIIGRFGTMTDFSDLTVFAECLDQTSHSQLTSVGEGVFADLTTNGIIAAFDNTQLISMTPL